MKNLLEDLHKLLLKQTDLYKRLLTVLTREKEIILSSSVEELTTNNKKKDVLVLQIKLLDESCNNLLGKIYSGLPEQRDPYTVEKLLNSIDEPNILPLKNCYIKLIKLVQKIKTTNSDNERLIRGSLRAIKSSISFLIACASSGKPCYESSGQLSPGDVSLSLFNEEA